MVIDLDDIIDAIQGGSRDVEYYLNTRTGDILMRSEKLSTYELMEIDEEIDKEFEDLILIPNSRDAGDIRMMREFSWTLPEGKTKDDLTTALSTNKGIFKRFKNAVAQHGLLDEWYEYEDDRYMSFAKDWCEANEIAFQEVPKIVYRRAVRGDIAKMVELRKKQLGITDDSLDFELERYFAAQMRNGALHQIFAWWKNRIVATGAIAWVFTPPTEELHDGRIGYFCNFYCEEELKGQGYEKEIISRLIEEAKRRKLPVIYADQPEQALLEQSGFKPVDGISRTVLHLK